MLLPNSVPQVTDCCGQDIPDNLPLPQAPLKIVMAAAAVLINREGEILMAQRPEGKEMAGLWEFPGGKIDPGESPEYALVRELHEELGILTCMDCLSPLTFASHRYEERGFHLLMPLYACRKWKGQITAREGQKLQWTTLQDLNNDTLPILPADKPLIPILFDLL